MYKKNLFVNSYLKILTAFIICNFLIYFLDLEMLLCVP